MAVNPFLSVVNRGHPETDGRTCEFQLYADRDLRHAVAAGTMPEGDLITSWPIAVPLARDTIYFWRARTRRGDLASPWTPTATFEVMPDGWEPEVEILAARALIAGAQAVQCVRVDEEGAALGAGVEIPPGALPKDRRITIGRVLNPPALPPDTLALGEVLAWGPSGNEFGRPIAIQIPYRNADLAIARVDPRDQDVFMFDMEARTWDAIEPKEVDEERGLIVCEVDRLGLFTLGKCVAVGDPGHPAPIPFLRGDTDGDGELGLADMVFSLQYQFAGGPAPSCLKAMDGNDDGMVDIADPIFGLNYLLADGPPPPPPLAACGPDPTADGLPCTAYLPCRH